MVNTYQQFIIAFVMILRAEAFENTEFCQKMAIKDCAAHLSEIFQALEQRTRSFEKCTEFQVPQTMHTSVPSFELVRRFKRLFFERSPFVDDTS